MKKYILRPSIFLFFVTVLLSSWSYESDFIKDLQTKLSAFYKQSQIVKIHIILNQPKYVAGDTAFFKVHLLSSQDLKPIKSKQIINVNLIGNDGNPILHNRIISENGMAQGQFIIADNLAPGNYLLIAYSDDMKKSVAPSLFYQSSITIAGPKEFITNEPKYLEVFCEGGILVSGKQNKLIVQTYRGATKATIFNSSKNIVEDLEISTAGLASVIFTPVAGEKYYVEVNGLKKQLPPVVKDGVVLRAVKNIEDESILVTLQVPPTSQWRNNQSYLVLNMQSKIYFSTSVSFKRDTTVSISIPIKNCPSGVAQLTVFSTNKEVLSERLIFVGQPDLVTTTLVTDTIQYQTRKPVKVDITVKDSRGNPIRSDFSLSVYEEDLFPTQSQQAGFLSNVLLSDLGYNQNIIWDKLSEDDKDNFLITQHWKTFRWEALDSKSSSVYNPIKSLPVYFSGKIVSPERKFIPDSTLITFYLNKRNFAYEVYARKDGQFEFPMFMNFGDDEVFYSVRNKDEVFADAQVLLTYDSISPQIPFTSIRGSSDDAYFALSKRKYQITKSFQYYLDKQKTERVKEIQDEKNSLLNADFSVNLEKYPPFPSMVDILNDVVPLVRFSKMNGKSVVRVFSNESSTFLRKSPLYIIDGIMTDSTAFFLDLNPAYVSKISILQSRQKLVKFGSLGKNGIIIVETKIPDHARSIPRTKKTFKITGLSSPLPFNMPNHGKGDATHIPDIRPSLYWNPELRTDDNGETEVSFYTSDGTGNYILHIEGITDDGRPFVNETKFKVSNKPTGILK